MLRNMLYNVGMEGKQVNRGDTKMSNEIKKDSMLREREEDGRFALKLESKSSIKRWAKRDAEIAKRRKELEAEFGDMADCFA